MATKRERREVVANGVKVLHYSKYGYGLNSTDSYFYRVEGEDGNIYTVSTSKEIWTGDKFVASVMGETDFRGEHQIKLSRVSILEFSDLRPKHRSYYIGNLISTDGEY